MNLIQIYEPAFCSEAGVCGDSMTRTLAIFASDVEWAVQGGAQIERFDLARHLFAFAENEVVRGFLNDSGAESLPLILVNGKVVLSGRYPTRGELARWAGIAPQQRMPSCPCCGGRHH